MPNTFIISDTWFNRLLEDNHDLNIIDNNDYIIGNWNSVVKKTDVVYVLGGFGIGDLYHIIVRLNGEIHFLNNYFNDDEKYFMVRMKEAIEKSSDIEFKNKIFFDDSQVIILKDLDSILSYFPLESWTGKSSGTYCFHGLTDTTNLLDHNISCVSKKWEGIPVNVDDVQKNIELFDNEINS